MLHRYVPLFAGQGTLAANNSQITAHLVDASVNASFLLARCHEAFHAELKSLPPAEFVQLDLDLQDFTAKDSLLTSQAHPILAASSLFLFQILRYMITLETEPDKFLNNNSTLAVLGFSSGLLPACVVAAATTIMNYTSFAIEAYRLSLWIGIRAHLYRFTTLNEACLDADSPLSWSMVFLGMEREILEQSLLQFRQNNLWASPLYITATVEPTCFTVSGRPDTLDAFAETLNSSNVTIHRMPVHTLYHAPVHMRGARDEVLSDASRRQISFPSYADLKVPIYSTLDGSILSNDTPSSLLQDIVDMILVYPVNWSSVVQGFVANLPDQGSIRLANVGPGTGLLRSLERALPKERVSVMELGSRPSSADRSSKHEPVAIIGMAVNLPGAQDTTEFWKVLENGINTVSEIPKTRFNIDNYGGKHPKRQMKARHGNFLENADEFDNNFFRISPREARNMDPQQRILLQAAYIALEDSGYVPDSTPTFNREMFGCYVGGATHDYAQNLRNDIDLHYSTGTLTAFLSGRISYAMQFGGPSMVSDTACSSSSVAIYQGVRALINGDANAALVGGVNIISSPDMYMALDRGHFLSPTGQCKSFDASADGYCRAEGCAMFVLKRLADAVAENDHIYGIIRSVEVNQSGLSHSITHPHSSTQASLYRRALESSGLDALRVSVIEAHGTGTQAGDPTELESLRAVFSGCENDCRRRRPASNPLHVMSVKANIGHLEAASGAAGLAKLLLMLRHRKIPPQISLEKLNPSITPLGNDNTVISTVLADWSSPHPSPPPSPTDDSTAVPSTRVALLNNFGAAGSNTAIIIEEHLLPPQSSTPPPPTRSDDNDAHSLPFVFGLSAKTNAALEQLRTKYLDWLKSPDGDATKLKFSDMAYTATARRQIYDHRIAVCASSSRDLIDLLEKAPVVTVPSGGGQASDAALFVFSGQGRQYRGMGRSLYLTSPTFREHVDASDRFLRSRGFDGVLSVILGEDGDLEENIGLEASQTALFAVEYALAKLWISWGVVPAALIGHSLGEYVALAIANVITPHHALLIIATRARLMLSRCQLGKTGMLAVHLAPAVLEAHLANFASLTIACFNSTTDCVVSGSLHELEEFKSLLETTNDHCKCTMLDVPFGYHSPAMNPLLDQLDTFCQRVPISSPSLPIVSNVHGSLVLPGDDTTFTSEYFSRHCAQPVRFDDGVWAILSHLQVGAWIEIGPHPSVLPMLKAHEALPLDATLLPSLRKRQDPWSTLTASLAHLYRSSVAVQWRQAFSHVPVVSCVQFPSYPFAKTKFWVPYVEEVNATESSSAQPSKYTLIDSCIQYPTEENGYVAVFETSISRLSPWITAHRVAGTPLCPASVYIEQALAAIVMYTSQINSVLQSSHPVLCDVEFLKPLVQRSDLSRTIIITVDPEGCFSVKSRSSPSDEGEPHVRGRYKHTLLAKTCKKLTHQQPRVSQTIIAMSSPASRCEVFSKRTAYDVIFPRVVQYSAAFHTIQSLKADNETREAFAVVKLPEDYDRGVYMVHPVFLDTMLHVAGLVSHVQGDVADAYICTELGSVKILPDLVENTSSYEVFCRLTWLEDQGVMVADAFALEIGGDHRIVAHFKGIHFKRVRLDALCKSLSQASGTSAILARRLRSSTIAKGPSLSLSLPTPSSASFSNLETTVLKIISEICDVPVAAIDLRTTLVSLGFDSLMTIEAVHKLQVAYPSAVMNVRCFGACKNPAEIVNEISRSSPRRQQLTPLSPISPTTSSPRTLVPEERWPSYENLKSPRPGTRDLNNDNTLVEEEEVDSEGSECELRLPTMNARLVSIQPCSGSAGLPLYLVHDGSGLVDQYERISPLNRAVFGISNPRFSTDTQWDSVEEMAASYAEAIMSSSCGKGPVIVGGWSFGGVVAYQTAFELSRQGVVVGGVLLIDSPCPTNHVQLTESVITAILPQGDSKLVGDIRSQFIVHSALLGRYKPSKTYAPCPPLVLLRSSEGYTSCQPALEIPDWLANRADTQIFNGSDWEHLVGSKVNVIDIPGHHFDVFHSDHIKTVSQKIAEACSYFENLL